MKTVVFLTTVFYWSTQLEFAQERLPRPVTVKAIPGVIAHGMQCQPVWQGTDNADGIVGTSDGGLLFAQEQPSTVRKLEANDQNKVYIRNTRGTGALAIDTQSKIIAVQRTCTDPGRGGASCS